MKKVVIFAAVVILIFAAIAFLSNKQQTAKTGGENNLYGKADLDPATVNQLDDPLYQNIITPSDLEEKLKKEEAVTVYYFSPLCSHCKNTTPILMPVAEEMNQHIDQYNVLEFEQGWNQIDATPTLIHYKNGKETSRIEGERTAEEFKQWFEAL